MAMLLIVSVLGLVTGAGAASCNPVDSCPKLSDGLYCPVNNVTEHGDINRDVKLIADYMGESPPNYAAARTVYAEGHFSSKGSSGMRTLQAMAQKDMTVSGKYNNAWYTGILDLAGSTDGIWHDYMLACLNGTGICGGRSHDFRKYIINKCGIGIVGGYATYEMGAAVWKADDGSLLDTGAPYAWDEAAAFYIGNVVPANGDGYTGSAPGNLYSPYEFMWKRDKDFPDGEATHETMVPILNYGLLNIRTYNATNLVAAQTDLYRLMAIAAIRSALKYSWKAGPGADNQYSDKYHAEGWAYWRFASGWIASVSSTTKAAVQTVDALLSLSQTSINSSVPCTIMTTVEAIYPALGITCAMVGRWKDATDCLASSCSDDGGNTATLSAGSADYVDMCNERDTTVAGAPHSATVAAVLTTAAAGASCALAL